MGSDGITRAPCGPNVRSKSAILGHTLILKSVIPSQRLPPTWSYLYDQKHVKVWLEDWNQTDVMNWVKHLMPEFEPFFGDQASLVKKKHKINVK